MMPSEILEAPKPAPSSPPFAQAALQARQEMDEVASLAPRLGGLQPPSQPPQGGAEGQQQPQGQQQGAMPPQQMPPPPQPDAGPQPMQPQGPTPSPGGQEPPEAQPTAPGAPVNLDQALEQLKQRYMAGGASA